ncbi:MAG: radical SAM protein, partial [Acidimicrobiia bacterium]|nr:radical SAM protein [Acidimicrobiia bacterium]MDX2467688.1 radical SAM protein [Acidimicrobiia bacterium]
MVQQSASPFQVMLKPRGAICNLDCSYCYFLTKQDLYPGSRFHMSDETLEEFTRQYLATQPTNEAVFGWQGGEPTLLGLDFYEKAVALQHAHARPGMRITNALQTNGTLLDDDWCHFLKKHDFLVGISIDGPQELHDAYRVDKGGLPTHHRVMAGLDLLKRHEVEFNVLTTVHAANQEHGLEVYRFLRDGAGAQVMQFIPI